MSPRDRKVWARNIATNIFRLAIVLLFLGLAIWAITLNRYGLVIANHEPWLWLTVALVSMGPELAGIVIGVVTIDYLNERRQDEQLKEQLILQLGSTHNDVTDIALSTLKARGWLGDGSLIRAILWRANLGGAVLWGANLSEADLRGTNLSEADLRGANLSRANLWGANLSRANLWGANLSRANLREADLSRANLREADLSGAAFWEADLSGAAFWEADLSGADLKGANLSEAQLGIVNRSGAIIWEADLNGAYLLGANLSRISNWTIEQLEQAETLGGAIMPDEIQLGADKYIYNGIGGIVVHQEPVDGPTFQEWKAQYLTRREAERLEGQSESDSNGSGEGQSKNDAEKPI